MKKQKAFPLKKEEGVAIYFPVKGGKFRMTHFHQSPTLAWGEFWVLRLMRLIGKANAN
jgi:hypothetical protein